MEDIPMNKEDISVIVSRYLILVGRMGLSDRDKLKGLEEIVLGNTV